MSVDSLKKLSRENRVSGALTLTVVPMSQHISTHQIIYQWILPNTELITHKVPFSIAANTHLTHILLFISLPVLHGLLLRATVSPYALSPPPTPPHTHS